MSQTTPQTPVDALERARFEAWALDYHELLPIWTGTRYRDDVWEDLWLSFQAGASARALAAIPEQVVTVDSIRAAGGIVHSDGNIFFTNIDKLRAALLASSPSEPVPLTVEQINLLWDQHKRGAWNKTLISPVVFAQAIEAAHGIVTKEST